MCEGAETDTEECRLYCSREPLLAVRDTVADATSSISVQDCRPADKTTWQHNIIYNGGRFLISIDDRPMSDGDSSINPIAPNNPDIATMTLIIQSLKL